MSLRLCPLLSDSSSLCSLSPLELLCVLPGVLLLRFPCVYCTSDYVPRVVALAFDQISVCVHIINGRVAAPTSAKKPLLIHIKR